ncbi:hypothetical protein [Humidesulfovibrio idahonensis]
MKTVQHIDALNIIHRSETLTIARRPATQPDGKVYLSFTGMSHMFGQMGGTEFARSLEKSGVHSEILFISDLALSWYNTPAEEILSFLEKHYPRHKVVTLGNSMGGYGSLLFSRLLPNCELAVNFSPQYSVLPEHAPGENRWLTRVDAVQQWKYSTSLPEEGNCRARQYVLFGATNAHDLSQAGHFTGRLNPGSAIFILDGCGHGVAPFLKNKGLLPGLLGCCFNMDKDADCVGRFLKEAGVGYRILPSG